MIFDEPHTGFFFRNSFLQTYFASYKFKKLFEFPLIRESKEWILETETVKLQSFIAKPNSQTRGILILLHGWEGSADSAYIIKTGNFFFNKGYTILRINMRDHGDTHHWNEGLFHGARLDDLISAFEFIKSHLKHLPIYMAGFSLGGNYVLRLAIQQKSAKSRLKKAVAISPAIDPYKSTVMMDQNPLLKKYFLKAWKDSLNKKQNSFPHIYDFQPYFNARSVMELTDLVVPRYSPYSSAREYFQSYTFSGNTFQNLSIDSYILCAHDDPVIDTDDFYKISFQKNLKIFLTNRGGHNGFFQNDFFQPWYLPWMEQIFSL